MPTINAVVYWADGKGQVDDITVPSGSGSTTITWTCGDDIASFAITGLDPTEFSPAESSGQVASFTTTDADDRAGDYSYTVAAVQASTGMKSSHDPKIENEV